MRKSKLFLPTLKEIPKDATIQSHILMLRAGFIRKSASGFYSYLPLGFRTLKKVIQIVEEEMDRIGAQEFLPPIVTPRELWEETGRYQLMGPLMYRLKDRNGQDFVLGPTHEESFTDLIRNELNSYRQLPLIVYQVGKKFRDEIRPRFGVMRGREFFMKDAYSYHRDAEDLDKTYQDMRKAYRRFFIRCGLETVPVQADSGAMGGKASEEFMVKSHIGEETILECPKCKYVANSERAECAPDFLSLENKEEKKPLEKIATPDIKTIDQLTRFFKTDAKNFIKTLVYQTKEKENFLVLIRGDLEVNPVKLTNALGGKEVDLADENTVLQITGAPIGFAGPVGIQNITILADYSIQGIRNGITGANEKDFHYQNVNIDRDFTVHRFADLRLVKEGDACPACGEKLLAFKGIEVGHIFKLGYKYTEDMQVYFLDEKGQKQHPIMGCYGIGIDRTIATVIEQNNDADGMILPITIAPFSVIILPLVQEAKEVSEKIYQDLWEKGIETLLDDTENSPGMKFKDADLIGIPIRVTIGKKSLAEGKVEVKLRKSKEILTEKIENTVSLIERILEEEKAIITKKLEAIGV